MTKICSFETQELSAAETKITQFQENDSCMLKLNVVIKTISFCFVDNIINETDLASHLNFHDWNDLKCN